MNQWLLRNAAGFLVAALIIISTACGREANLVEVRRIRSGDLDVILLSPDGALHQKETFTIEFRTAAGSLVNVGAVSASASMPMPGMGPMLGSIEIRQTDAPGRYTASGNLDMAGGWRFALNWNGPRGQGTVNFTGTVQ